jgi:alkylation response protein AidB-like acyl-CoA dehydrogenase
MPSLDEFRQQTRDWIHSHCPDNLRGSPIHFAGGKKAPVNNEDFELWFSRCLDKGYTVPSWPKKYGGAELSKDQAMILGQEMRAYGAPTPLKGMGISMIGPTLLELGTEEQKDQHLPGIASGKYCWCQGYSEPGAGSDLASLQTKAISDGDDYVVNGSKIWTSGADRADWIYCLVRTDSKVPKHEGISFLIFSMDSPGVSVKGIELISGGSSFCQTFFTDVRVPKRQRLGEENHGWSIAKRLLQHERYSVTDPGSGTGSGTLGGLPEDAKKYAGEIEGRIADPALREQVIINEMNGLAFDMTVQRSKQENEAGEDVSFATSMFKYYSTKVTAREDELRVTAMGSSGMGWQGDEFSTHELAMCRRYFSSRALRIAGGTDEVQFNIIAKRVLSLPD